MIPPSVASLVHCLALLPHVALLTADADLFPPYLSSLRSPRMITRRLECNSVLSTLVESLEITVCMAMVYSRLSHTSNRSGVPITMSTRTRRFSFGVRTPFPPAFLADTASFRLLISTAACALNYLCPFPYPYPPFNPPPPSPSAICPGRALPSQMGSASSRLHCRPVGGQAKSILCCTQ
ncbi:hypothetical protein B0H10DRAFT_1993314 [Mycena sp. CBHHK59/15]|nr:hypothetical protein B0H10DRAFT_1993314 [Mycena sp. CBHHK59/15]